MLKRISISIIIMLLSIYTLTFTRAADTLAIDTISACVNKNLPCGWKKFKSDNGVSIHHDSDNCYIHLKSENDVQGIGKGFTFEVKSYPLLNWRWRANTLPRSGQENVKKRNDSALGVYVFFKGGYPFGQVIKYVWSSTLPIGTMVKSPYSSKTMILVIESGGKDLNKWISEERNLLDDYQKAFGSMPPAARGIAIMTDSDNTHSSAIADYDDFYVTRK